MDRKIQNNRPIDFGFEKKPYENWVIMRSAILILKKKLREGKAKRETRLQKITSWKEK